MEPVGFFLNGIGTDSNGQTGLDRTDRYTGMNDSSFLCFYNSQYSLSLFYNAFYYFLDKFIPPWYLLVNRELHKTINSISAVRPNMNVISYLYISSASYVKFTLLSCIVRFKI